MSRMAMRSGIRQRPNSRFSPTLEALRPELESRAECCLLDW